MQTKKTPCELGRIRGELNAKFQVPELYHTAESAGFVGSTGTCGSMSITGGCVAVGCVEKRLVPSCPRLVQGVDKTEMP